MAPDRAPVVRRLLSPPARRGGKHVPEPETRFDLARVVRVNRGGMVSHACRPHQWERGPKANGVNRLLAPAAGTGWLQVRRVWKLPRGVRIDDELAGRTFHTEDKGKAALRERLPTGQTA